MNLLSCVTLLTIFVLRVAECVIFSWFWSVDPLEPSSMSNRTKIGEENAIKLKQTYCTKDKHCGQAKYCHRHYGMCYECKTKGEMCRRDHVCCKDSECVFGSCRKIIEKGNFLAKCKKDKHCKKGLCCAKSHGEFVCKPMLKENQICSVLKGGVAYSVSHSCPCDDGLVCRKLKVPGGRLNKETGGRKKRKIRRCQKVI